MQECKFKVGDVVRRVEWIDSYSNKPNNGEPWKISGIEYEEGEWFLGFEGDTYGIEWEAERFALVSRAEEQHVGHKYCIWCETCQGSGEIDETLGGTSTSSAHVPCPDCKGRGYWIRYTTSPFGVDGVVVHKDENVSSSEPPPKQETTQWTDKHYDAYYTLTQKDIEAGKVKIDPYFVAKQWRLGEKDDTGVLFHNLKNISRYGEKNSKEREIKALYAQIKRLAEIEGVEL